MFFNPQNVPRHEQRSYLKRAIRKHFNRILKGHREANLHRRKHEKLPSSHGTLARWLKDQKLPLLPSYSRQSIIRSFA